MTKLLWIYLFLFFSFGVNAQNTTAWEQELKSSKGIEKVKLHLKLARAYFFNDSVKTSNHSHDARNLSKQLTFDRGIIDAELLLARLESEHHNQKKSVDRLLRLMGSDYKLTKSDSAEIYAYLSVDLSILEVYATSIQFRRKLLELRNLKSGPDLYYPLDNMAYDFLQLQKYDSANYYYAKAQQVADGMNNFHAKLHCLNNTGYGYYIQKKYSVAFGIFEQGTTLFENTPVRNAQDSILYAMIWRNRGLVLSELGKFSGAIEALEFSSETFLKLDSNSIFLPRNSLLIAECYLRSKDFQSSEEHLEVAATRILTDEDRLHYFKLGGDLYAQTGREAKAVEYLKKYIELKEKMSTKDAIANNIEGIIEMQTLGIARELELQKRLRDNEQEINRLEQRVILIVGSLMVVILLLLLIKFYSDRKKKEKLMSAQHMLDKERLKLREMEQERLEETLSHKNKDLTNFAIDITRKHDFIEEVLKKLKRIEVKDQEGNHRVTEVIQFVRSELSIDNNLKLFQENIDLINSEFMTLLESRFPDLTKSEKQLCGLLRLQLNSKEIATVKNISSDSVKTMRHRIRKKLDLHTDDDLGEFLNNLE